MGAGVGLNLARGQGHIDAWTTSRLGVVRPSPDGQLPVAQVRGSPNNPAQRGHRRPHDHRSRNSERSAALEFSVPPLAAAAAAFGEGPRTRRATSTSTPHNGCSPGSGRTSATSSWPAFRSSDNPPRSSSGTAGEPRCSRVMRLSSPKATGTPLTSSRPIRRVGGRRPHLLRAWRDPRISAGRSPRQSRRAACRVGAARQPRGSSPTSSASRSTGWTPNRRSSARRAVGRRP